MNILLLKPKALFVLTRFADACSRAGVDMTIMMAPRPPTKHYLVSFANDSLETIDELAVAGDDDEAMAPLLGRYDAVVAAGEYSVLLGERLSARLGLFHNPLGPIESYRDKYQMRQRFADAGVNQPKLLAKFSSMEEVEAFDWSSVRFPVIVKPIDLSSSFYVRLCDDADSAKKIYRRIFKHSQSFSGVAFSAQGLLEEVAMGPEYSIECVVDKRKLVAAFLTSKLLSAYPTCDEVGHISGEPWLSESMQAQAERAVEGIIRAWQLESAVLHVEFKWCDGEVKVIEAACRIGGDLISTITEKRHGVSLEECLVLLRCRGDVRSALARHTPEGDGYCYGVKFLFHENQATPLDPSIEVLERVRHAKEDTGAGGFGVEQRLGHVLVRSRSAQALRDYIGALGH
ncbi:acetyl-CoA carboxylase biotin carboxylase subunit family protein [Ideonella sp.]|uniref:ATP-grasp domain-containing protein n=1 Tax=Ideonella sp. TaxID=1929293 RepID=UPI0035B10947